MTFLEWFCDVEFTGRSKDLAEMAYNAANVNHDRAGSQL